MKKFFNSFKVKTMLCALPLFLASVVIPTQYNCFIFIGEPEVPECLKEN
ncbi:cyclic lactone autoinducer peptide [Clostridium sp. P21]|uniref:Cyclic lactone autoinducer peptide n=1 Tax=Clostridium muellerianum TaxID=2716538 RepID=A0A7Y0EI88_9CLOT|nr:cyclic lactone autoinducer peptide [Clostridium muellerianum]NMM63892.1 cyclic lactone autoinducer peptide [Clostridium muellerianum]